MITIRDEQPTDIAARDAMLTRAFGVRRFRKTSERLRHGRLPAAGLAFTAASESGRVIGTVRLWHVIAGSAGPSLLLGPLAVETRVRGKGVGRKLLNHALAAARGLGHESVLLVGDASYYGRYGFTSALTRNLHLPGPVERARFLGLELNEGAFDGAEGLVVASGRLAPPLAETQAA